MMETLTVQQTKEGWQASDGRNWNTAAEAEREIRETAPVGVLVIEWEPTTRVGRMVVQAIVNST